MAKNDYMALVLEVTQGCGLKCGGCVLDKQEARTPTEKEYDELLDFLYDVRDKGMRLNELEIGPTDLMTADNREELLGSEKFKELGGLFDLWSSTASLYSKSDKEIIRFTSQVNEHIVNGKCNFKIPYTIQLTRSKRFLEKLQDKVSLFLSELNTFPGELMLVLNFHPAWFQDPESKKAKDYAEMFEEVHQLEELHPQTKIVFNLQQGRNPIRGKKEKEIYLKSMYDLNDLYRKFVNDHSTNRKFIYRHLPCQLLEGKPQWEVNYINHNIFILPIFNERLPIFNDYFLYKGDWTYEGLKMEELRLRNENYILGLENANCSGCSYLPQCGERNIQRLQTFLETEDCFIMRNEFKGKIDDIKFIKGLSLEDIS